MRSDLETDEKRALDRKERKTQDKVEREREEARGKTLMVRVRHDGESDKKRAVDKEVHGRRRRGRSKTRLKECTAANEREAGLDTNTTEDRGSRLRRFINNKDPT